MKHARKNGDREIDSRPVTKPRAAAATDSESIYLADQAADARRAMIETVHDMSATVRRLFDVSETTSKHPWVVTGIAGAIGFATGALLTSPRREHAEPSPGVDADAKAATERQPRSGGAGSFLYSAIGLALTAIVRGMLQGTVSAIVAGGAEPASEQESSENAPGAVAPKDSTERIT